MYQPPHVCARTPGALYPGCPFGDALNTLSAPFGYNEPSVVVQAFDNATAEMVRRGLKAGAGADDVTFHLHALNSSLVRTWKNHSQPVNVTRPDSFQPLIRWSVPAPSLSTDAIAEYGALTWPVLLLRKKVNEPEELIRVSDVSQSRAPSSRTRPCSHSPSPSPSLAHSRPLQHALPPSARPPASPRWQGRE